MFPTKNKIRLLEYSCPSLVSAGTSIITTATQPIPIPASLLHHLLILAAFNATKNRIIMHISTFIQK